jgi:hypothetical protein
MAHEETDSGIVVRGAKFVQRALHPDCAPGYGDPGDVR